MTDDDLRAAYDGVDQNTADWHIRGLRAVAALVKAEQPQPEPSEAEVAAAMASLHRDMEPAAWPSEDEVTDALRAAAAARKV